MSKRARAIGADVEIEAKLLADARVLDAVAAMDTIAGFRLVPRGLRSLESVYLDTPDGACRRERVALRLRRWPGGAEATVKLSGRVAAGLHERPEWTVSLRRWPRLPGRAPRALRRRLGALADERFVPVAGTRVERRLFELRRPGARAAVAELALDRVELVAWDAAGAERRGGRYAEIEVELRSGQRRDLAAVVRALRRRYRLRAARRSKLERALRFAGLAERR